MGKYLHFLSLGIRGRMASSFSRTSSSHRQMYGWCTHHCRVCKVCRWSRTLDTNFNHGMGSEPPTLKIQCTNHCASRNCINCHPHPPAMFQNMPANKCVVTYCFVKLCQLQQLFRRTGYGDCSSAALLHPSTLSQQITLLSAASFHFQTPVDTKHLK